MANFGGSIGMTYSEVTDTITKFGNTRHEIYNKVQDIKNLVEASKQYWQGATADAARENVLRNADKCYNCGKWINEWAYSLQQYANQLREQDQRGASTMASD